MKIRQLEWRNGYRDSTCKIQQVDTGVFYQIRERADGVFLDMNGVGIKCQSVDEAKALAQDDYEKGLCLLITSSDELIDLRQQIVSLKEAVEYEHTLHTICYKAGYYQAECNLPDHSDIDTVAKEALAKRDAQMRVQGMREAADITYDPSVKDWRTAITDHIDEIEKEFQNDRSC